MPNTDNTSDKNNNNNDNTNNVIDSLNNKATEPTNDADIKPNFINRIKSMINKSTQKAYNKAELDNFTGKSLNDIPTKDIETIEDIELLNNESYTPLSPEELSNYENIPIDTEIDLYLSDSIETQATPKKTTLSRILSMFKNEEQLSSYGTLNDYSYEYSKFREYIFLLDEKEDEDSVIKAIELCDGSLKLDRHRAFLNEKKKEYDVILKDLECYEKLSEKDTTFFKNTISSFLQLTTERRAIRYQAGDFNSSINKLEALEKDAVDAIYQIEDAEKSKRAISRDISLLKDEKERTDNDREKLQFAYKVIYKFSLSIAILLATSIIILTLILVATNEPMIFTLLTLCIILVFITILIYIFRRKIVFELKLNDKKQARLITLLNKKTVVYSYYINFLNFTYNKYGVKNSRILKSNLKEFSNYKHLTGRYDNLGKLLVQIQSTLEEFIQTNNITVSSTTLEGFAKSINVDNKIAYLNDITTKRKKTETRIKEIDTEHEKLWNKLVELNTNDTSREKVITKIMQAYLNETEKILTEETEEEDIFEGDKLQ